MALTSLNIPLKDILNMKFPHKKIKFVKGYNKLKSLVKCIIYKSLFIKTLNLMLSNFNNMNKEEKTLNVVRHYNYMLYQKDILNYHCFRGFRKVIKRKIIKFNNYYPNTFNKILTDHNFECNYTNRNNKKCINITHGQFHQCVLHIKCKFNREKNIYKHLIKKIISPIIDIIIMYDNPKSYDI
jgi:hypothetical protein